MVDATAGCVGRCEVVGTDVLAALAMASNLAARGGRRCLFCQTVGAGFHAEPRRSTSFQVQAKGKGLFSQLPRSRGRGD